ncbi:MAG: Hsp20/alpha crystallin family protein [Rhodopila sp.]|nr:Hsp20/alpha crystallin family protein [Rhodopila sp.]
MATTPVPVKQSAPAVTGTPDIWRSFRTEMDRLFDRFTGGFGMVTFPSFRSEPAFTVPSPAVDITEGDTSFTFTAELPGMTEKDIQVSLSGNTLLIKGEKRQEKEEKDKGYYLSERSFGEFQRSFILPEGVDGEKIDARFANGVLTVTVPKTVQATPKKIEVKAA